MNHEQEVLAYFEKEIKELSQAEKKIVDQQMDRMIADAKEEYRDYAKKEQEQRFRCWKEEQDREHARRMAQLSKEKNKVISDHRQNMERSVFEEVKARLLLYCDSAEYHAWLNNAIAKQAALQETAIVELHPKENIVTWQQRFPHLQFRNDDTILIGGYRWKDTIHKTIQDHTFDTLLEEEKTWFYENSKLLINP